MEFNRPPYTISTDPGRLDQEAIHRYLSTESYWARGRSPDTVRAAIEHSLCFGLYDGEKQAGFARVVTDHATFAWLCDVFVLETYRGQGLGKWLVECVVSHPELQAISRLMLATRDAHELYKNYGGFAPLQAPERWMERVKRT